MLRGTCIGAGAHIPSRDSERGGETRRWGKERGKRRGVRRTMERRAREGQRERVRGI